jgi:hypothetical protein
MSSAAMFAKARARFASAADLLRPRTFFRTLARVDRIDDATRQLSSAVEALRIQTEQLMEVDRLNWDQQEHFKALDSLLDAEAIGRHVKAAVAAATLETDPFPHIIVDQWLPPRMYEALVRALPPPVFFNEREVSRQRVRVPLEFAPMYAKRVWRFMADEVVGGSLNEALQEKFGDALREYIGSVSAEWPAQLERDGMHPSDGRIMLRRPGYVIHPHRDPKWGFIVGLIYIARENDAETYGTQLYRVRDDVMSPNDKPFYVDPSRCELVKSAPFRGNTLLSFLNSKGAHGASIPEDAMPVNLERYLYQFRLGPSTRTIKRLLALMPAEERGPWMGGKVR